MRESKCRISFERNENSVFALIECGSKKVKLTSPGIVLISGQYSHYDIDSLPNSILKKRKTYKNYSKVLWKKYGRTLGVVVVGIDQNEGFLLSDPLSRVPLFVRETINGIYFSDFMPDLLPLDDVSYGLSGAIEISFFGFSFEGRTALNNISVFPPASEININIKDVHTHRIPWEAFDTEDDMELSLFELRKLIRSTIHAHCGDLNSQYTILLSGGLDSRLLAAELTEDNSNLNSITYGSGMDYDSIFGPIVAAALELKNTFLSFDAVSFKLCCRDFVLLSGGCTSITNARAFNVFRILKNDFKLLHGLPGDLTFGAGFQKRSMLHSLSDEEIVMLLINRLGKVDIKTLARLWGRSFKDIKADIEEILFRSLSEFRGGTAASRCDRLLLFHKVPFDTIWTVLLAAQTCPVVTPFHDMKLTEIFLSIKSSIRFKHQLYKKYFKLFFPNLAKIPWQKEGVDLFGNTALNMKSFTRRIPYSLWFGGELRKWILDALIGKESVLGTYVDNNILFEILSREVVDDKWADFVGALIAIEELWKYSTEISKRNLPNILGAQR